jgi:hypothetical protein
MNMTLRKNESKKGVKKGKDRRSKWIMWGRGTQ